MKFNKIFTSKLDNPVLAQGILALRRDMENELENVGDYYTNGFIAYDTMINRSDCIVEKYDRKFIQLWVDLGYEEQVRLLATWGEIFNWALSGYLPVSDEMITAVRIMK